MSKAKKSTIRTSKVTDDDRTINSILREDLSAADLQRYSEMELMVPADQALADLDEVHRKRTAKKKAWA
jgi:hypothetical protein